MQIRQKIEILIFHDSFQTNFLDVLFNVESESENQIWKFLFVDEIWAKNEPKMQIRQKIEILIFYDSFQNQVSRHTF